MISAEALNVLMVSTQPTGGGAARCAESLARLLQSHGGGVEWLVRDSLGQSEADRATHWRTGAVARTLSRRGFPELGDVSSFAWPCRTDWAQADVAHLHNLHGDYLSILAAPWLGFSKPLVWTLHDHWPLTGNCATPRSCQRWRAGCGSCPLVGAYPMGVADRSSFYRRVKPRLFQLARPRLVAPSAWLAGRVREVAGLRELPLRIIRYPIDCQVFAPAEDRMALRSALGLKPERPTVVMSGHGWGDPFKGADQALAALAIARRRVRGLQLLVVGGGAAEVLASAGLEGLAIPFQRDRAGLTRAYACADVCLFPSRAENYPLTVLESMACETPAVAFAVGGIPEQIEHERTGWLAPDGDAALLAEGLIRLLSGSRLREMGRLARRFVLQTSDERVVLTQYLDEYRRAIRDWRRRHGVMSSRRQPGPIAGWVCQRLGWMESGTVFARGGSPERPARAPSARTPLPVAEAMAP